MITFVDGTTVTMEPSTGMTIASLLEGRASQPLATAIALQQESGVTWSNVPSLVASSLFQIETAAAVVLVRGTSIKVTVERQTNRAQVDVYSGVAQVRARGEEVQLTPGTQSLIPVGAGPGEQLNIDAPSERLRFTMSPAICGLRDQSYRTKRRVPGARHGGEPSAGRRRWPPIWRDALLRAARD